MRTMRSDKARAYRLQRRSGILAPNPSPGKRWTKKLLGDIASDMQLPLTGKALEVAVPNEDARLRSSSASNTIYANGIPGGSFIGLGNGIAISSPELLFAELAESMHPVEHLMLGHELCGSFCRDAGDPYNGPVTYFIQPVTSADRIRCFLEKAKGVRGIEAARISASFLNDNAWSPTESLTAALMRLPIDSLGYDLGELVLNPRIPAKQMLPGAKESRVPDIMIAGTAVGINYDGLVHLDLKSIVAAAINVGVNPGVAQTQQALTEALNKVRSKMLDDIRRNRELSAHGLSVFPLLKEDLYVSNGLDQVVAQLIESLERTTKRNMKRQRKALRQKALSRDRHRIMLSLLPGHHERDVKVHRFIEGHMLYDGPSTVEECWMEL